MIETIDTRGFAMRWSQCLGVSASAAAVLLAGCAVEPSADEFTPCSLGATALSGVAMTDKPRSLIAKNPCTTDTKDFEALVLSGGGPDGAFGAAFLATLIKERSRAETDADGVLQVPRPCLVTGISTGAVMAPYVYLATSENPATRAAYVDQLHDIYATFDDSWLFSGTRARILRHNSLYDVSGIKAEIESRLVRDNLVDAIRVEYAQSGRKLLIGATDLYTGDFEVVDLTSYIAVNSVETATTRHCIAEAIRASAAIPVLFPPVPILDGRPKLYADGGVRHMVFLNAALYANLNPASKKLTLYGVVNNIYVHKNILHRDAEQSDAPSKPRYALSILEVASRSEALGADQLYQDSASITNSSVANLTGRWVDGTTAQKCAPLLGSQEFAPPYQKCLMNSGDIAARSAGPWGQLAPVPTFVKPKLE